MDYKFIDDLGGAIEVPRDGTLSKTVFSDRKVKAVLFGFDQGQELSEHTASMPAIIQIVKGTAQMTLGGDSHLAHEGAWVYMPAGLSHSIQATEPLVMLLVLLKNSEESS